MINIVERKAVKLPGITNLFISFEYDINILNFMRNLPNRYYHKENKEWEIPLNKLPYILQNLDEEFLIEEMTEEIKHETSIPEDYKFKTMPFPHQIEGIEYGLNNDCWILGDQQGLGKTKQVIDLACILKQQNKIKHCLIVCGVNNLKWNWQKEVSIHSDEKAYILGSRYRKNGKMIIGSLMDRIEDLDNIPEDTLFLITNVETFRNNDFRDKLKSLDSIQMMAIDEAHKIKDPTSDQGKNILKVDKCKYKV